MNEEELDLLIKVAAREQRYACVDSARGYYTILQGKIQNTPCPDVEDVKAKWRKMLAQNTQMYQRAPEQNSAPAQLQPSLLGAEFFDADYIQGLLDTDNLDPSETDRVLRNACLKVAQLERTLKLLVEAERVSLETIKKYEAFGLYPELCRGMTAYYNERE